jgi:hypothetical protein
MPLEQSRYLAYMLRLWQVKTAKKTTWRASLESSLSGERQGFASLDDLFEFLRRETDALSRKEDDEGQAGE